MKSALFTVIAACLGMIATSGVVAFAMARPLEQVSKHLAEHAEPRP